MHRQVLSLKLLPCLPSSALSPTEGGRGKDASSCFNPTASHHIISEMFHLNSDLCPEQDCLASRPTDISRACWEQVLQSTPRVRQHLQCSTG